MPRPLKSCILFYSMLANHHVYYKLARLTGTFKVIAIDFQCCILSGISLEGYQTIWVGPFSFAKGQQALYRKYSQTSQDHPAKRTSADMELRNYPKPKHLIFRDTKHEKTIIACSYLNFSIHKIHQNSKKWWLFRNCLVKMTLRLFQSISVAMNILQCQCF